MYNLIAYIVAVLLIINAVTRLGMIPNAGVILVSLVVKFHLFLSSDEVSCYTALFVHLFHRTCDYLR